MSDSTRARQLAAKTIAAVLEGNEQPGDYLRRQSPDDAQQRAFAMHLTYGVLRWKTALDWLMSGLLNRPLKKRDSDIRYLIQSGLFQLWKEPGSDHAVVHASAEAARNAGKTWAVGLINAVLRRFQREQESWIEKLAADDSRFAHPPWLLEELQRDWPGDWQDIVDANNLQAPLWLRVNTQRSNVAEAVQTLQGADFETRLHTQAPEAISVNPAVPVAQLPGFSKGLLSVQDPAAQLAAHYLAPAEGERVLDACAAPGGKTSHLLELNSTLDLLALDRDPNRCALITQNLDRLGLSCEVQCADASDTQSWWDGNPFDRILLDAPCSATGVIRRHPEIKHIRTPEQVRMACSDQHRLLEALWPLLNRGGILVYATCSVLKCENHEQIHRFLSRNPDADEIQCGTGGETGRQILPGEEGMDGFFYALLRKSD